jgi:hypothetical protein
MVITIRYSRLTASQYKYCRYSLPGNESFAYIITELLRNVCYAPYHLTCLFMAWYILTLALISELFKGITCNISDNGIHFLGLGCFWACPSCGLPKRTQSMVWGNYVNRGSVVGIATSYWLDDRGTGVWIPVGLWGSGVYPTSYPMDTGRSFPEAKAAGAWSWPLTYN